MRRRGRLARGGCRAARALALVGFALGAWAAHAGSVRAQAAPGGGAEEAVQPRVRTATGGLLGGVRPVTQSPVERAEAQLAQDLADVAAAPGHEAADGALAQARQALARAREQRSAGAAVPAARALAIGRAALELAGRQAALARERAAARAAGRARDAALERARAAHEALVAAERERARAAGMSAAPAGGADEEGGAP